ncbi:protein daughter of sevenless [Chironomus tepperi]|uniref:protein daughter of sevenless n=1 Tax=Chironomus tepperi TaxID=113505 RepID=UPI00391F0988
MHKKNVEIYHCGWLVKSPPNPKGSIFKARWRRRWFTLKQGELPGQFFLEYFTDNGCRKRKGVIDLDQVEQVDAGLSLDRATIKFQFMFDMKTPNRTYYLAADNEQDMRDWVMIICQVCNLQETEDKNGVNESSSSSNITAQYYNIGPNNDFEAKEITQSDLSTNTDSTLLTNTVSDFSAVSNRTNQQFSIVNEYENDDFVQNRNNNHNEGINYSNLLPMESSLKEKSIKSTGAIKKIPENLKLRFDDKINNNGTEDCTLNRASGPYIPLSDCFSGSPVLFKNDGDPKTPLNSLDPKFYETPRSHITNIGLNLTDDQPNSPKKINLQQQNSKSINSSPTDSGDSTTDEEWNEPKIIDRKTRPSDSSIENEAIITTSGQSYMKMSVNNPIPLPPKRISIVFDKKQDLSDTEENVSPISASIGPKEKSSFVEDCYDFPRSHNIQLFSGSHRDIGKIGSSIHGHLMTSTPNLIHSSSALIDKNFYGNAPPRERNVFVFDHESICMPPPPEVNRTLKPKKNGKSMNKNIQNAPVIDRKLKPSIAKPQIMAGTNSLKRRGPETISLTEVDDSLLNDSLASNQSFGLSPKTPDRLQYLDLDHTSSPQKSMLGSIAATSIASNMASLDISFNGSIKEGPGVAYTTVDFLKTDAFNRVREDSEMTRASKSRIKN